MSVQEYADRMEAFNLAREDEREYDYHKIWMQERIVSASDQKSGKYIIKNFDEFYKKPKDQKEQKKVFDKLHAVRINQQKYREKGGN